MLPLKNKRQQRRVFYLRGWIFSCIIELGKKKENEIQLMKLSWVRGGSGDVPLRETHHSVKINQSGSWVAI